jgi:hypothetical protein
MVSKKSIYVVGISLAILAASRRVEATRDVFIPGANDSFFSFLPFVGN